MKEITQGVGVLSLYVSSGFISIHFANKNQNQIPSCNKANPWPYNQIRTSPRSVLVKIEFLTHAGNVFDEMPELDSVFWTVLIVRYSLTSRFEVAHRMFFKTMKRKAVPTECTSTNILASCAAIEAFDVGKKVRSSIVKFGLSGFVYVANYLLNMYKKSGSVEIIVTVFERIKLKDVSTWNAIIAPHAQRGQMEHTLAQFEEMKERDVIS